MLLLTLSLPFYGLPRRLTLYSPIEPYTVLNTPIRYYTALYSTVHVKWLFLCSPRWVEAGFRVILKDFEIKKSFICGSLFRYYIKQIDSMLPCVCSVIDHRRRQNVVRTSVTHLAIASCATFLFLPHFDIICDLLLNRCTATWNLFVKFI